MKSRWLFGFFLMVPVIVAAQEMDVRAFLKAAEVASRENSAVMDSVVYWVTESSVFQKLDDEQVAEQDSVVFRVKRRGNEELERKLIFSSQSADEDASDEKTKKSPKENKKEEFSVAINFDPDSSAHVFTKVGATDSTCTFDFEPKSAKHIHEGFGTVILGRDDKLLRQMELHIPNPQKKALKKMDMVIQFEKMAGFHQPTNLEVSGKVKALLGLIGFDFRMKTRFSQFEFLPVE